MNRRCEKCGKVKSADKFYMHGRASKVRRKECSNCTLKHRIVYDWRKHRKGWKYSSDAPENKQWQKDRSELFAKSGNGWWWFSSNVIHKKINEDKEHIRFKDMEQEE